VGGCFLGVYLRGVQLSGPKLLSGRNCCPAEIAAEVAALIIPGPHHPPRLPLQILGIPYAGNGDPLASSSKNKVVSS
jgi:hypothetical protein